MSKSPSSSNGDLVLGLLGILFVGLKLTGYINWSWWWVTAPFWGGLAIVVFAFACSGLFLLAIKLFGK